jgi:hypothetical protein
MNDEFNQLPQLGGGPNRIHFLTTKTYRLIRRLLGRPIYKPDPAQFNAVQTGRIITFTLRQESLGGGGIPDSPPDGGGGDQHPWKATPNGDAFVNIAKGCVTGFVPMPDASSGKQNFFAPFIGIYQKFEGGSVEVSEESGYVYIEVPIADEVEGVEGSDITDTFGGELYAPSAPPTLVFSDSRIEVEYAISGVPIDGIKAYIPICEVSKAAGVAAVDYQILTHNPSIQLDALLYIPAPDPPP